MPRPGNATAPQAGALDADAFEGHVAGMTARVRKLIGGSLIVVFVVAYAAAAVTIVAWLPDTPLVRLVYYGVVGIAWGLPVIPLITWMNRGR